MRTIGFRYLNLDHPWRVKPARGEELDPQLHANLAIERGELGEAHALQAALGLTGDLPLTWPHNLVRHARGCLHAAAGDHAAAVADLLAAGELAERWGIPNPAILPWRSSAARTGSRAGRPRRGAPPGRAPAPRHARSSGRAWIWPMPWPASHSATGPGANLWSPAAGPAAMPPWTGRPYPGRTASRAASSRRADQPADRTGPVRHPANGGDPPDQHIRQTPDQLPQRAPGRTRRQPHGGHPAKGTLITSTRRPSRVRAVARLGAQDTRGLRADDPVSDQAVMRLEVDHVHLGDRAEHAVRIGAGFLLYHCHVSAVHEG